MCDQMKLSEDLRKWSSGAGPIGFFNFMIEAAERAAAVEKARDVAIELLTQLQAERDATVIGGIAGFTDSQHNRITHVIGLLDGSLPMGDGAEAHEAHEEADRAPHP